LSEGLSDVTHLPLICLASGRTTLADKFFAVAFAVFLVAGGTLQSFATYMSEIVIGTFDFGVEYGLGQILPVKVNDMFPWIAGTDLLEQALPDFEFLEDDTEFQAVPAPAPLIIPEVSLNPMLQQGGLLHMTHNAADGVLEVMPIISKAIDPFAEVCTLVRETYTCTRLRETCFTHPVAREFHPVLKGFKGKIHRARWGTVAFALDGALSDLQRPLRRYWSLAKYMDNLGRRTAEAPLSKITEVDESIESSFFWAKLITLDFVYSLIRLCFEWIEGCACHFHLDFRQATVQLRKRWERCPMRWLRLDEVAAGDFFEMFRDLCEVTSAQLPWAMPVDISTSDRSVCLQEFERGRGYLTFQFTVKLAPYTGPPNLLFATSHHMRAKSVRALKSCLESDCEHPRIRQLQSPPLCEEAKEYIDGEELHFFEHLPVFVVGFKFGWASERAVEGGHAHVNLRAASNRYRTEAYDSLVLRLPVFQKRCEDDPSLMASLADCLMKGRSPAKVVSALHLQNHPSCRLAKSAWDPIYRKIVYHSDPYSLHSAPRPPLHTKKPPGPPASGSPVPGLPGAQAALDDPPEVEGDAPAGAAAAVVISAEGIYSTFVKEAALKFFVEQVSAAHSESDKRYIYACRVPAEHTNALASLTNLLTLPSLPDKPAIEDDLKGLRNITYLKVWESKYMLVYRFSIFLQTAFSFPEPGPGISTCYHCHPKRQT
jgi:hypothetical protein